VLPWLSERDPVLDALLQKGASSALRERVCGATRGASEREQRFVQENMGKRATLKADKDTEESNVSTKTESTTAAIVPATPDAEELGPAAEKMPPKDAVVPANLNTIEDQVRQRYLSVVYTHKTHEKDADICTSHSRLLKLAQSVASTITAGGAILVVVGDNQVAKVLTAIISLVAALVSAVARSMDFDGRAYEHRSAATGFWELRQAYESLLVDIHEKFVSSDVARTKRDELFAKEAAVNKKAPRTTSRAYVMAQEALKYKEEYTSSPEEIDIHLPPSLRKANRK